MKIFKFLLIFFVFLGIFVVSGFGDEVLSQIYNYKTESNKNSGTSIIEKNNIKISKYKLEYNEGSDYFLNIAKKNKGNSKKINEIGNDWKNFKINIMKIEKKLYKENSDLLSYQEEIKNLKIKIEASKSGIINFNNNPYTKKKFKNTIKESSMKIKMTEQNIEKKRIELESDETNKNNLQLLENLNPKQISNLKLKDIDFDKFIKKSDYQQKKIANLRGDSQKRLIDYYDNPDNYGTLIDTLLNPQSSDLYVTLDAIRTLFGYKARGLKDANGAYRGKFEAFLGEPIENIFCYAKTGVGIKTNSQASSSIIRSDDEANYVEVSPGESALPTFRIQAFKTIIPIDNDGERYYTKIIYDTYLKATLGNNIKTKYEYSIVFNGKVQAKNSKPIVLENGKVRRVSSQVTFNTTKGQADGNFYFILKGLSKNNCDDECFSGEELNELQTIKINFPINDDHSLNYIFGRNLNSEEKADATGDRGNGQLQIINR